MSTLNCRVKKRWQGDMCDKKPKFEIKEQNYEIK